MAVNMGKVVQFRDDWKKTVRTIAATGCVIEHWERIEGDRRASISRSDDGPFRWRAYVAVKHRPPRLYQQKFKAICDVQESLDLIKAKNGANAYIDR